MPIDDKLRALYGAMLQDEYITEDDISEDDFVNMMKRPGQEGTQVRQDMLNGLKEDELVDQDVTYDDFIKSLEYAAQDTMPQQPGATQPTQPGQPQQPMQPGEIPEAQQQEQAAPQKPQKPETYYIGGVEVGKVKMPETPNVGLNLGNSQVTIGYRPGQTFTSGGNPAAYREPDDKPIGGLAKVFGEADDDTIIRDYVRNTVGKAIDDAKAAGLKEAESNTIYGSVNGMGALYNAAVVNRRQDPRLIMQSIVDGMSKSIAEDKYLVEMAQKNAAVEGMTVKDYVAQRLYPYLKQQLQQELYQRLLDMHMPTGTLQWFIDGFSEGGLFGNIIEGIVNTREQQEITNMARQITSAGQNPYFVPGHWDNFYRGAASLTGMLPEFMVGGMGGEAVATRVFGRGATRLAAMGFTESERAAAMLMNRSAMGLGKRMLLTVGEGSLSGAVTLGSVDAAHSVSQQLRDKNGFSIMEVGKEAMHGAATGTAFGVTGGVVGAATARAAGAARTAAKIGKFATEAATLTGMSMYDKIKAGMPIDLGDEAINGVMQTIAMKVASTHTASKVGKFMDNPKQAVKDYLSSFVNPELLEPLSEETRRELEQVGDLVTQYAMIARGLQEYARQQQEAKGHQSTRLGIHEGGTSPEIDNSSFEQQQRQRFEQSATEKQRQILEQMKTLFANPGTTWKTRDILSQAMGLGSIPLPPVRRVGDVMELNDGKYVVETMSLDGKILERKTFSNKDDAWNFKNNQQEQATNNRTHRMMAAYPTQSNIAISRMLNEHGYDDAFINAALAKKPEDRTEQEQKMVDMVTDIQKALVTKRQDRTAPEDDYVDEWEDKMLMEMVPDDATVSMTGDMNGRAYVTISDENGQVIEQSRTMSHEQAGDLVEAIMNRQGQNIYDKAQSRANMQFAYNYYESFLQQESNAVDLVRRYDELKAKKAKDGLTEEEQAEFDELGKGYRHNTDVAMVINHASELQEIQENLDNNKTLTEQQKEIVNAQTRLLVDFSRREDVTDAMEKEYESLNNLPEGTLASIMTKPVTECDDAEKVIREGYLKSIGAWVKRSKEASTYDAFKLGFEATPQQRTTLLQQADEIERRIRQEKGYDENVSIADVVGFDGKNAESTKRRIMFGTDSDNVKDLFAQWIDMQVTKDGMQRSIDFEVKARIEAARKAAAEVTGKDGMVRGLRLVEKDGDGNPLQVYVKDGNIVLRNDGSIDKEASDNVIYVQAPGEDKPRPINVDLIESMDAAIDGRMYAAMMARQAEQEARQNAYAIAEPAAENGQGGRPGQNGQGAPAEGGTPPAEGAAPKKVKLAISGQDYNVEVLGEENGMVKLRDLESGEEYDLSRERFDAFAKAADDKAAAAQAEAAAQAQREENRKAGITGYAEGNPDLSHPDNDMQLVIDYLKEQEPAQQDRVKTQAATHIGTLNDNIESLEADVARRREWYENAKDMSTPENLSARKEALDKAEAELAEAKTRRDNWERVRVALMSDKELQSMKEERKASRQQWETEEQEAQKDSKPVLSGEKTPLDKDAVLEKYETRGEANQAMLSEFRRHDRRVGDIDNRIRYIDKQLDAWRDGEPMTEQDVRALIAEREALRKEEALLGDRMAALRNAAKKQLDGWYKEREQANMSESELKYAQLDKETDYNRKMKLAKEAVMSDKDIDGSDRDLLLMILDRVEPETVEEFVAENLPYGSINWEGLIGDGGRKIRGLKDELGGRRGIGHNYDTNAYNAYLAKKGEGKSPDQIAHEMWEASPEDGDGNKRWSDVEIKQAMLDLLQGAEKPTDISHRLPNDRIEEVLQMRDEMIERRAEEEAAMEAQQPETAEAEPQPTGEFRDPVTGEVIDPNEKVPFQKVDGEKGALTEEEVALRDALVEKIAPSVDVVMDERGQRVLDADADMRAKMMASKKNIESGLDALQKIASGEEEVHNAMVRDDLEQYGGDNNITFYYGKVGNPDKNFKKGYGIAHIGGKHGAETLLRLLNVIANGKIARYVPGNKTVILTDGEYEAVLALTRFGEKETWLFNGWRKDEKTGADGEVSTHSDATQANPTFSREDLGAVLSDANLRKNLESIVKNNENIREQRKISDTPEEKERTALIFDTAKKKFGLTNDLREAGYILPDGTMLDFSGRHELFGADDSGISGRRATDHRGISQIAYAYDAEGNEIDTGVETTMPDFIERGAIRIDANAGTINLSVKPTAAQRKTLQRLIQRNGGDVSVDYGNGWDSDHYSEYDSASAGRVLSDIDRYFDEGIRTDGNIKYFRTSNGEAYGFTLGGKIYIDPRIARADTPIHEYTHLWAEGMRESDPEGWKRVVDLMRGEKELWEKVKKDYPELKTDDELADEVLAHYSGTRGAERLREEMRKIAEGDGTLDAKTRAIAALENVRRALNDFWRSVANKLGIKFTTAEEVADMVLRDMLNGVDPRVRRLLDESEKIEKEAEQVRFSIVDDPKEIERLENEPKEKGYRNVVMKEDGSFGSPMADRLGSKGKKRSATTPFGMNQWERSDENPDLATEDGKIDLIKPGSLGTVNSVDYNPYIHIRPTTLNKQFKNAWERPDLVYVETEYPASELTSGYRADKAKKTVGKHPWGGGELILSRWDKPVRIVPWEEVANEWEAEFKDTGVNFDIVPPKLLPILAERGVEILPPHKGMGKECNDAYLKWKESQGANGERVGTSANNVSFNIGKSMSEVEAKSFVERMQEFSETAVEIELTPENWIEQFGEDGIVSTPIGEVKMGENQYFKLAQQGRKGKLGMVKPTLENPDIIVEDNRPAKDGNQERDYSYVFVKTFVNKDGERYYHFTSVTVQKDGKEVVISNQERRPNRISKLLQEGKVTWTNERFSSHPNTRIEGPVPLNDSNRPTSTDNQPALLGINSSEHSESKDSKSSSNLQANGEENLQESENGVEFVGESRSTSRPVPQYIKKYFGSTTGDEFSNQEKDTILEGYNHIKAQNPHAIAMIKTPKGYVLINEDRRMLSKDLGATFAPFVLVKPNDVDLVRSAVVSAGKMIGSVDINDNAWRKAAVRPMPQPKTNAAPEGKPLSNTGTTQTEKDPGVYGWADRRRSSYWNEEPEFKSVSDAAWWCYDLIGNVRSASESKEYTGKDYSRLLSLDDSHGEQVDVEKAKKHAGMVIPMAEMMKKHLIVARDRSKSEAAARYVQGLIDECDNAIDWYQRAAKGDRTIFDDERPRMFRVSRDGKALDKKTVDGTWTESEVRVMEGKLGGTKVTIDTEETIPETVRRRLLLGEDVKGWYDESDGSVHLYAPAIESVEDARYTICHEKLGHEGLTALLGSQQAVTDWGNFMYLSASRDLRAQMDEIARTEFAGDDNAKSKAAQEVFAQIAEDGPRSKEEFSLWRRVKHFFIKQAQKRGWNVRGLLNDADMRYYVLKTGEALKRYEGMDDAQKMETSRPGLLFSTGGSRKPRKRQNESMASFLQRLERWEVERQREEDMRLAGAEAPEKEPYEQQWQAKYEEDDAAWRERHGLTGDEPEGYPRRQEGESDESLMQRVREYEQWEEAMRDQDDKRPIVWEYEQKAYHEWRDAVKEFERQWGIEDEDHAALDLFDPPSDGPVDVEQISPSGRPMTPEEAAAEHATLQELGDALGADMSARGAKRHTKLAVIQRRKDLEGRSAEDAIYVHELSDKINAVARRLIDETGAKDQSKKEVAEKIRHAIPFIIEMPRRQREIADDINSSLVWQYGRLVTINGDDIAAASRGIDDLRDAINRYGIDSEEAKDAARRIADIINARHEGDIVGVIHEEVVNNGAVEYLTDLMNNTEPAHRGGKPIPETTPDEIRQNADDLERLRLHLSQLAQAINAGNVGEVRDSIVGDINAVADRYVEAFNARHAEEISNGSRRAMTTGDLIDIMWLSRTKLKENAARIGVQGLTGSDVLAIGSMFTRRMLPEEVDFPIDRVQDIVDEIGDWYSNWFMDIENAGLRPQDIGRVTNYVNHRWEHESGLGAKIGDENYQRTRSANMRERTIPTLMTGLEVGLTPKSTDIVDLMSYYSRHNAEAVANKGLIDALENVKIYETDADGEPVASVSLLTREEPELARDKYELYDIPGQGLVWVHKEASNWFANVFGPIHTSGEKSLWQKTVSAYDTASSTAKKIELSFSGFHMGALTEVYIAQMIAQHPKDGLQTFVKFMITDCIKKGTLPCYANPEVYKDAAKHLVKLGANDDYANKEVVALTAKFREMLKDTEQKMAEAGLGKTASKAVMAPDRLIAYLLDWANNGMDAILWSYLHDGLKLAAYDIYARDIRKRAPKEGWDETTIDQMLDEAGQYVNDMFGGQYWEIINVSPAQLKLMQRFLLSPDWLISTNRHIFATIGAGSLYSDQNFKEYLKNNWGGLKRLLPKEYRSEKDIYRAFRSTNSKWCYLLGVLVFNYLFWNGVNFLNRKKDIEEQQKIAEERRAAGDDQYMSPYESIYGEDLANMKWWDYTMFGNAMEKKTHAFYGRGSGGQEVYLRWGKQFREFPELFENEKGEADFPFPLMNRLLSKANPMASLLFESLMYSSPRRQTYWDKRLVEQYGMHTGYLMKIASRFKPFSMPSDEKESTWIGLVFPTSKGFTFNKAKDYLRDFMEREDWEGVREVYRACALNGIDFDAAYNIVANDIEKTARQASRSGIESKSDAVKRFDASNSLSERKTLMSTIENYQSKTNARAMRMEEAVETAKAEFTSDKDDDPRQWKDYYILGAKGSDIEEDSAMSWLKRQCSKYKGHVKYLEETEGDVAANLYRLRTMPIQNAAKNLDKVWKELNELKKEYARAYAEGQQEKADETMRKIREKRSAALERHKKLAESIVPFDETAGASLESLGWVDNLNEE